MTIAIRVLAIAIWLLTIPILMAVPVLSIGRKVLVSTLFRDRSIVVIIAIHRRLRLDPVNGAILATRVGAIRPLTGAIGTTCVHSIVRRLVTMLVVRSWLLAIHSGIRLRTVPVSRSTWPGTVAMVSVVVSVLIAILVSVVSSDV